MYRSPLCEAALASGALEASDRCAGHQIHSAGGVEHDTAVGDAVAGDRVAAERATLREGRPPAGRALSKVIVTLLSLGLSPVLLSSRCAIRASAGLGRRLLACLTARERPCDHRRDPARLHAPHAGT
jgi:hypothetical protein